MKRKILLAFLTLAPLLISAQGIEYFLLAKDDASLLLKNYISPVLKGSMSGLNNGWYTTAKTHKKFGFDITLNASLSTIPSSEQFFNFDRSEYSFISLPNGETKLPTLFSDNNNETEVDIKIPYNENEYQVAQLNMPGGVGDDLPVNGVPTPMAQVGLGLPFFNTDLIVRYTPKINSQGIDFSIFGLGIKHSLMQYFGLIEKLPLVDIAAFGGFTKLNAHYNFNDINNPNLAVNNGGLSLDILTWNVQLLASLDLKIINLYAGLGLVNGSSTIAVNGDYTLRYTYTDQNNNSSTIEEEIKDPLNIDFSTNSVQATIGARLNLLFFKLFSSYSFQEYNTLNVGAAFSFR